HRGYRFDVRSALRKGTNELTITFASPVKYAEAMHAKNPRPYVNGPGGHFNAIRKMACNFGWDWGPALPTCGIWRGIRVEGWSVARIETIRSTVVLEGDDVILWVDVKFDESADFYSETRLFDPQGHELAESIRGSDPEG